jgi:dCTP deaminase
MILTGPALRDAMRRGVITIAPCDDDQIDQAGVTLHLHPRLLLLGPGYSILDVREPCEYHFDPVPLDSTGAFLLEPGRFYLGATIERIYAPAHVVRVDGKSSPGRKSLEVHRTAGHVEPGFGGQITLEISVLTHLRVPPGWPVCQAVFHEVTGAVEPYDRRGHYADANEADGPQPSRSHLHRTRHV